LERRDLVFYSLRYPLSPQNSLGNLVRFNIDRRMEPLTHTPNSRFFYSPFD